MRVRKQASNRWSSKAKVGSLKKLRESICLKIEEGKRVLKKGTYNKWGNNWTDKRISWKAALLLYAVKKL